MAVPSTRNLIRSATQTTDLLLHIPTINKIMSLELPGMWFIYLTLEKWALADYLYNEAKQT